SASRLERSVCQLFNHQSSAVQSTATAKPNITMRFIITNSLLRVSGAAREHCCPQRAGWSFESCCGHECPTAEQTQSARIAGAVRDAFVSYWVIRWCRDLRP